MGSGRQDISYRGGGEEGSVIFDKPSFYVIISVRSFDIMT
jgi:hypothetical protein